jgi:hypothetical protein
MSRDLRVIEDHVVVARAAQVDLRTGQCVFIGPAAGELDL